MSTGQTCTRTACECIPRSQPSAMPALPGAYPVVLYSKGLPGSCGQGARGVPHALEPQGLARAGSQRCSTCHVPSQQLAPLALQGRTAHLHRAPGRLTPGSAAARTSQQGNANDARSWDDGGPLAGIYGSDGRAAPRYSNSRLAVPSACPEQGSRTATHGAGPRSERPGRCSPSHFPS